MAPGRLTDSWRRRHRWRQHVGIAFVAWVTIAGRPMESAFVVGAVGASLGILVRLWASGYVVKNDELATTGPYALVRHPLYLGNTLIAVGFCAASGLWISAPLALAILLVFYPPAIRHEDAKLQRLFPDEWPPWAARTPALAPFARMGERALQRAMASGWSLRLSLMRNGEPIQAALMVACLLVLHGRLDSGGRA